MSKPDIEALDDGDAYPYSSHISVDGTELQISDLLLVFDSADSHTVNFFERVYGFTWPGVITHVVDGPVPAEFHDFEDLAAKLDNGKIAIASERERTCFFVDEETVRTLTLYRYFHQNGWQPILVDERRDPLENRPSYQEVVLCSDAGEVIDELFENHPSDKSEADQIRDFLLAAGYEPDALPPSETHE
ncbi:hypothetical protein [Halostella pelagica]|uniref:hypothetical protein n=1 Tax=Halostella pelagica TaxID=2583824 RepID=UPI00108113EF|nr:hypothetical protein [Halostella pelagica]